MPSVLWSWQTWAAKLHSASHCRNCQRPSLELCEPVPRVRQAHLRVLLLAPILRATYVRCVRKLCLMAKDRSSRNGLLRVATQGAGKKTRTRRLRMEELSWHEGAAAHMS